VYFHGGPGSSLAVSDEAEGRSKLAARLQAHALETPVFQDIVKLAKAAGITLPQKPGDGFVRADTLAYVRYKATYADVKRWLEWDDDYNKRRGVHE
jgi:hypothetical protein